MIALLLSGVLQFSIQYCLYGTEVMVELYDEIIAEVVGHSTTVACGKANNLAFFGDDSNIRTLVEGIYHDVGAVGLGEGEAHEGGTLRGA